jgi:hypothetical protein
VLRLQAFAIAFAEVAKVLTVLDRYEARRKRELATTARLGWFKKPPRFQQRCGQIRRGSSVRGTTSPKGPALTLRQLQPYRGGMMCCLCPSAGGPFSIFPIYTFKLLHDGVRDLVLFVLRERSAHAANEGKPGTRSHDD